MLIAIDSIMIDERATVRIVGKCTNPGCHTQNICRDIDALQIAAFEAALLRVSPYRQPPVKGLGH